jgi:hypothetical protein
MKLNFLKLGSLKGKIRAIKGQLSALRPYGELASQEQIDILSQELSVKKGELKKAALRYYRLGTSVTR